MPASEWLQAFCAFQLRQIADGLMKLADLNHLLLSPAREFILPHDPHPSLRATLSHLMGEGMFWGTLHGVASALQSYPGLISFAPLGQVSLASQ